MQFAFNHIIIILNKIKMPKSERNCCVVDCHNNERKCEGKDIKFYSFPGRPWEVDRRKRWIQAVARKNEDGTNWEPTKNSRVCSVHFVGGKVSNIASHPAYVPSIFPSKYTKRQDSANDLQRYERTLKRKCIHEEDFPLSSNVLNVEGEESLATNTKVSIGTQAYTDIDNSTKTFLFESNNEGNNLVTQCNISDPFKSITYKDKGVDCCIHKGTGFLDIERIDKERDLKDLTGINFQTFELMFELIPVEKLGRSLSPKNSLLLFLMKMKLGISFSVLGLMFGVSRSTVTRLFVSILDSLSHNTKNLIMWPSKHAIRMCLPKCFEKIFPNTRVIIDCTEIKTEQPGKVEERIFMYSSYKNAYTFKFLIGISPNGLITFKSKCYGGRASDSFITVDSGLLGFLESGDVILADKGFPGIKTHLNKDMVLVTPPVLHNGKLTEDEILDTYSVASVRIHVERCIQRIKIFKILEFIPQSLFQYIDDIVHMACVLANFQPPIIKEK